jgi:hypothetical protein
MNATQTFAAQLASLAVLLPVLVWSGLSYVKAVYAPHPDATPEYQWDVELTADGRFVVHPVS